MTMQLEMIMRQVDALATDLQAVCQLIKEDIEHTQKLVEESRKQRERGDPLGPATTMPSRSGWIQDKLSFIKHRLELTLEYLNNQSIG